MALSECSALAAFQTRNHTMNRSCTIFVSSFSNIIKYVGTNCRSCKFLHKLCWSLSLSNSSGVPSFFWRDISITVHSLNTTAHHFSLEVLPRVLLFIRCSLPLSPRVDLKYVFPHHSAIRASFLYKQKNEGIWWHEFHRNVIVWFFVLRRKTEITYEAFGRQT